MSVQGCARCDRGRVRRENEDAVLLCSPEGAAEGRELLAVVADGVGGTPGGAVASRLAVESVKESYFADRGDDVPGALRRALHAANRRISSEARSSGAHPGMATTCTATVVRGGKAYVCHVGDSRAYLFGKEGLRQITDDHTLVAKLLSEGRISAEEATSHPMSNVISKALGLADVEPDSHTLALEEGDVLLLCSDGLYRHVTAKEMSDAVARLPVQEACRYLVERANEEGGTDNISVVVISRRSGDGHPALGVTKELPVQRREGSRSLLIPLAAFLLSALCLWYLFLTRS